MFAKAELDEFETHFFAGWTPIHTVFTAAVLILGSMWIWSRWKWEQAAFKEIAESCKNMIEEYERAPPELRRRLDEWAVTLRRNQGKSF